ncbi:MAG: hypothetical protein ACFFAU_16735 [Candidatus Hodarchaeota archaeon]
MRKTTTAEKNQPWCPWCSERVEIQLKQKILRLQCKKCGMDAYITKGPNNKKASNYKKRKMSS